MTALSIFSWQRVHCKLDGLEGCLVSDDECPPADFLDGDASAVLLQSLDMTVDGDAPIAECGVGTDARRPCQQFRIAGHPVGKGFENAGAVVFDEKHRTERNHIGVRLCRGFPDDVVDYAGVDRLADEIGVREIVVAAGFDKGHFTALFAGWNLSPTARIDSRDGLWRGIP